MSKVISIFSTKGGVGKTFVASNLATSLFRDERKRVLLMDFDLQGVGDLSRMLNLGPQKAMVDLISAIKKGKAEAEKQVFITHTAFGFDFLPAVLKPQQTAAISSEYIAEIFKLYSTNYDYVVIDAGKSFNDVFMQALNQSNLILLLVTPDILSVYQTKWVVDTLQSMHFPLAMLKVMINRSESVSSISPEELQVNLTSEIVAALPSEGKTVGLSINRRVPVVVDVPKSGIAQAIKKFAHKLVIEERLFISHRDIGLMEAGEEQLEKPDAFWKEFGASAAGQAEDVMAETDQVLLIKRRIHNRLIDEMNIKRLDVKIFSDAVKKQELRKKAEVIVSNLLTDEAGSFISSMEVRNKFIKEIVDEALGLGALEDLLSDPSITDIMVNNKDEVYIERHGKIEATSKKFISNDQVKTIIERIIAPTGRRIDESVPMVDSRLADGSRVNAIIPPLALTGPTLTIRKFRKEKFKIEELIGMGSISQAMADFIKACVVARKNVIVSGGTGSGKTTVLNILSAFIPNNERIITIEDAAELKLSQEHWIRLESRPPNIEGKGMISIRELFRNSLRMRPDRIIIGECRGAETLDMLQAMNTGHDGSMTTVHANSTQDVLVRLDSMILMSGVELPIRAIREMIASALHIIVHTARLSDGTRKIIQISELSGMKDEVHIGLKDVFNFRQTGVDNQNKVLGNYVATGYIPPFVQELKIKGIALSDDVFKTA
ncbi:MAG: Flp pilus assembly complex ATPase component TadA [Candidatus Omnitrophica bacterium]|nr:Flp pilus assembly complex ATPase component TadA [Candidatus Omnitrophota bacterium]